VQRLAEHSAPRGTQGYAARGQFDVADEDALCAMLIRLRTTVSLSET
jgi:hypothetical protein